MEINTLTEERNKLKEKLDVSYEQISRLTKFNQDLRNDYSDLKLKFEDEKKLDDDRVSRAFFIQFLTSFNRNVNDFQARKEMLSSLINLLQLTSEEKEMLGIESKARQKIMLENTEKFEDDSSLIDKFTNFLSGRF